uniref:Reverse transcriptase n=1 Tax=Peronospora matthiolae TaxID=2874970 RepID=A0AAV1U8A1_9STRA
MREQKLFANLKKRMFAANKIPLLGCIVGKDGVRPDPEKIKAISDWPVPVDVKGLRKFLGLAAYLHKHSRKLWRDDRTSLSSTKEKREVVMERRVSAHF